MKEWDAPVSEYITVAVPGRMYWRSWEDPSKPAVTTVAFDWPATLHIMRSEARRACHDPIRWEVSPRFEPMTRLEMFDGLPVVVSEGSFCRLICKDRTYELNLSI